MYTYTCFPSHEFHFYLAMFQHDSHHNNVFVSADCNPHRCVCQLGFCIHECYWLGLGWCNLALQLGLLLAFRRHQVCCPIHPTRRRMGAYYRAQGMYDFYIPVTASGTSHYYCEVTLWCLCFDLYRSTLS